MNCKVVSSGFTDVEYFCPLTGIGNYTSDIAAIECGILQLLHRNLDITTLVWDLFQQKPLAKAHIAE